MVVTVGIMGCPARMEGVERNVAYFKKRGVSPHVFIDSDYRGPWWNVRRFYQGLKGDYGIMVQDDAILNEYAFDNLKGVVFDGKIDTVCCCWISSQKMPGWMNQGIRFLVDTNLMSGVTVVSYRPFVEEVLEWEKRNIRSEVKSDDARFGIYSSISGKSTFVSVPCITDHANEKSLVGHSTQVFGKKRVAVCLADQVYDWTRTEKNSLKWTRASMSPYYRKMMYPGRCPGRKK